MSTKTIAQLKRDAKAGTIEARLIFVNGYTELDATRIAWRRIVDSNTVSIFFLREDNGKKSGLDLPSGSLIEYTDESLILFHPGLRDYNAEELAFLEKWEAEKQRTNYAERMEIDAISDGSSCYYSEKAFFYKHNFSYLMGLEWEKGLKYDLNQKKVADKKIKGAINLMYVLQKFVPLAPHKPIEETLNVWIETDSSQYVKNLGKGCFKVTEFDDFHIQEEEGIKNITMYSLEVCILPVIQDPSKYYSQYLQSFGYASLEALQLEYMEGWDRVLAECIAETDMREAATRTSFKPHKVVVDEDYYAHICPCCVVYMDLPAPILIGAESAGHLCDVEDCENSGLYTIDFRGM